MTNFQLRNLLTVLFSSMTSRQQLGIAHIIISQIPDTQIVTDIMHPRRGIQASILPRERIWSNEQVEKSLSDGTAFTLVPALSIVRDGSGASPSLRWVWRSNVDRMFGTQTEPTLGRRGQQGRVDASPEPALSHRDRQATVDISAFNTPTRSGNSITPGMRPEAVLNVLARDIEETILQTMTTEISRNRMRRGLNSSTTSSIGTSTSDWQGGEYNIDGTPSSNYVDE